MDKDREIKELEDRLTIQQRFFVVYYLDGFNATEACKKAKYKTKSPEKYGSTLLRNKVISRLIVLKLEKLEGDIKLNTGATIELIRDAMHLDPADYLDEKGHQKLIHTLPTSVRKAIQSFTVKETRAPDGTVIAVEHTYRLIEKTKMIELLATIQKLKKDETDEVVGNLAQKLQQAASRVKTNEQKQSIQEYKPTGTG